MLTDNIKDTPGVTILMATYNGRHYICKQLDSLLNQTYTNWSLIVRDDGSTDGTIDIIKDYNFRYPQISYIINTNPEKGACLNFSTLFDIASRDNAITYIMFCDQDDVWKPEKIESSLFAMQGLEINFPNRPALIYTDFELMDSDGNFAPGGFKLKHKISLHSLLSFNYVYGCTTMLNRRLINKIGTIPAEAINHDYWIALVASLNNSKFINEKLLKYRQHRENVSGNVAGNNSTIARVKRNFLEPEKENKNLSIRLKMFDVFYKRYAGDLSVERRVMLENYLNSFNKSRFRVIVTMLHHQIYRVGVLQTLASFFQVLFFYKKIKNLKD